MTHSTTGYTPPPYPYERIDRFKPLGEQFEGGLVDFSIGTPFDPPPDAVIDALAGSGSERSYPPSIGTPALRAAARGWFGRRFGIELADDELAACIGTKEFVASLPLWLKLRRPDRDTVLYPSIAYPTYEMGAVFAGCRAVPVPMDPTGGLRLDDIDPADAGRALVLWVNSPANPSGVLDDLAAAAAWGRERDVPVFSDECYTEFTWNGPQRTILESGTDGVVAVHSLSKRSNLAGVRVGYYAGDAGLVEYLREVRKHAGMMVPGPAQAAGVAALEDDAHVEEQRRRYRSRLERMAVVLSTWSGIEIAMPDGGFYLWFEVGDAWEFTERLATEGGALVSPGDFYGDAGVGFVRVAVVQPDTQIDLVASRLGVGTSSPRPHE